MVYRPVLGWRSNSDRLGGFQRIYPCQGTTMEMESGCSGVSGWRRVHSSLDGWWVNIYGMGRATPGHIAQLMPTRQMAKSGRLTLIYSTDGFFNALVR